MVTYICTEMVLPKDEIVLKKLRFMNKNTEEYSKFKSVYTKSKLWPVGTEITIGFLDSPARNFPINSNKSEPFKNKGTIKESIIAIVKERFEPIVNLRFVFVPDNIANSAKIRISFDVTKGSSSYVGIDNLGVRPGLRPPYVPTMRFAWYDVQVVLHEFGHALGLFHEHKSPFDNPIQWNLPELYKYYAGPPSNWTQEMVNFNIVTRYTVDQVNGSSYDNESIMRYFVPKSLTANGQEYPENLRLSQLDVLYLNSIYPGWHINYLSPDTFYYNVYKQHITQCLKGYYNENINGNYTSSECPAGSYCLNCKKVTCPGGTYCPSGSVMYISCPGGSYCPPESSQPTKCPVGTYCPPGSSDYIFCPMYLTCSTGSSLPLQDNKPLTIKTDTYAYYFNTLFIPPKEDTSVTKLDIKNGNYTQSNVNGVELVLNPINKYVYLRNSANIRFIDVSTDASVNFKEIKKKVWAITGLAVTRGPATFPMGGVGFPFRWKYIGANVGTTPVSNLTALDTNKGIRGDTLFLMVKYEEVDPNSSVPVLTNLTASHFPSQRSTCSGSEIPRFGGVRGNVPLIAGNPGTKGSCWYIGSCVKYTPINQVTDFISSVMLSFRKFAGANKTTYVTYDDPDNIPVKINLDKIEQELDMHRNCADGWFMYLVYGKNTIFK